jgi:hypothetical protein
LLPSPRLNDFKTQETYYNKIVERYMKFCAAAGGSDELDRHFASLSIQSSPPTAPAPLATSKHAAPPPPTPLAELQTIHSAMRKLRESITATARRDVFAQRAYIFIIRAALLTNTPATYHPALLYLLSAIDAATPLPPPERVEFARYRVLDLACRAGDLRAARELALCGFGGCLARDVRVRAVLDALVRDDWVAFWRLRGQVDGYQLRLLGWAEGEMRVHALKCLGKSYFGAQRAYVERVAGMEWERLVAEEGVRWELQEDGWVVIRRPKGK